MTYDARAKFRMIVEFHLKTESKKMKKMKLKTLLVTSILAFLFLTTFTTRFSTFVAANPIPIPVILMPEEYINATISPIDGELWARVNGTYPFVNWSCDNVTMYYPVPFGAYNVSVKMNETSLDWRYSDENYSTVIGDFPMITWTICPVPVYFTIRTYYEHPVPSINGIYKFLYAMGTGKYLGEPYAKETTAYVAVSVSKDVAGVEEDISVYRIGYNATTGEWIWKPANYTITQEERTWEVTLTVVSEMFSPLEDDLLLTIGTFTGDINNDGIVDIADIVIAAIAFGSTAEDNPETPWDETKNWNPDADLNNDGLIDIVDLVIVAVNFGKKW